MCDRRFGCKDFGVDEWHGHNVFIREGDRSYRTYFIDGRGSEIFGAVWSHLDMTALGRQEEWEDSPEGWPQTDRAGGWWHYNDPTPIDLAGAHARGECDRTTSPTAGLASAQRDDEQRRNHARLSRKGSRPEPPPRPLSAPLEAESPPVTQTRARYRVAGRAKYKDA